MYMMKALVLPTTIKQHFHRTDIALRGRLCLNGRGKTTEMFKNHITKHFRHIWQHEQSIQPAFHGTQQRKLLLKNHAITGSRGHRSACSGLPSCSSLYGCRWPRSHGLRCVLHFHFKTEKNGGGH